MKRKRRGENEYWVSNVLTQNMFLLLRWWIPLIYFAGMSWCEAVQVSVRDDRRFAMLFQSVVLPCQYSSVSTQTPVVQWWYKSYCRDRTRDAFSFPETLGVRASELGTSSHLDCGDSGRTVRIVASGQGSSITLSEHYKGRDISIINRADLRIGELQWGDSGVYYCKVVISDDLEGKNEAQVELLVLGKTGDADDLLPEFELAIMPEWVFVGAVVLGSVLFILLVGVCWCQCCPHSCCCYVRCWCCPDTCCCPKHLYEAGKGLKTSPSTPIAMYPPYYVPGVPSMVPIAPPSLIDPKMSAAPSVENNATSVYTGGHPLSVPLVRSGYRLQPTPDQDSLKVLHYVEHQLAQFNPAKTLSSHDSCSQSELSSLHEAETDFRQSYRQVQKKALPAIPDLPDFDDPPDLGRDLSSAHGRRSARHPRSKRVEEDHSNRWNPRSEHLRRKACLLGGRTGSLDELEEFAMTFVDRGRHDGGRDREDDRRARERGERECDRERYPTYRDGAQRHQARDGPAETWREQPGHHGPPSPPPLPGKRRGTWDSDRPDRPIPRRDASGREHSGRGPGGRDGSGRDYDDALLSSLLERKARAARGGRAEEDSDTPSKKSSERYRNRSPSNQSPSNRLPINQSPSNRLPINQSPSNRLPINQSPSNRLPSNQSPSNRSLSNRAEAEDDSLPPYSEREMERYRSAESALRPFTYGRPAQGSSQLGPEGREEQLNKPRKVSTLLSRDSLIV